jgi:taurine dioxygenase
MRFRPLHPDFGAEVLDFNIEQGGTAEEIEELRRAYDEYSMLLFRGGGRLSHERHYEIASWFGPPPPVDNSGAGDFVTVLHNKDMAGSMQIPFHSDLTYTDDPIRAICLQAIELPDKPTSTTYVSGTAAWNSLPPELQEELAGMTLQHFYQSRVPDYDWPDFLAEHPVRLVHPRTGRPILFVTEHHAHRILELGEEESQALIEKLYTYLYASERKYEHVWQLNDVLMWDNIVLQHARTEYSDPGEGYRGLQRVALSNVTLQETIEIARARQAA